MTKDEAKTKICPFMARPISEQQETGKWDFCIAERCMAWEWETVYKHHNTLPSKPVGKSATDGYCAKLKQ